MVPSTNWNLFPLPFFFLVVRAAVGKIVPPFFFLFLFSMESLDQRDTAQIPAPFFRELSKPPSPPLSFFFPFLGPKQSDSRCSRSRANPFLPRVFFPFPPFFFSCAQDGVPASPNRSTVLSFPLFFPSHKR